MKDLVDDGSEESFNKWVICVEERLHRNRFIDTLAIYTEVARAHSGTTEVIYGEAGERGSQSIGRGNDAGRREANTLSEGLDGVR